MPFEITRASHAGAALEAQYLVSYSLSIKMHRAFLTETGMTPQKTAVRMKLYHHTIGWEGLQADMTAGNS